MFVPFGRAFVWIGMYVSNWFKVKCVYWYDCTMPINMFGWTKKSVSVGPALGIVGDIVTDGGKQSLPIEFDYLKMADSDLTISDFIRSRPKESVRYLISAVLKCLSNGSPLNEAEIQIQARTIRYKV